ncbi:MAG: hypothetical protein H6Q90_2343 [Deltaproteobacteria bacterium]|nr:hypothetical protein [Deltaproteobacteria bacterium]
MWRDGGSNRGGCLNGVAHAHRVVIATALCLTVHGCQAVDGGAVELSWKLRPASSSVPDKFVDCTPEDKPGTNPVKEIRLDWEIDGRFDSESWPCEDSHGVTGFELPPGVALFWVSPICDSGPPQVYADPASYIAPAVEQRNVILGDTVSLGAVELVVQVGDGVSTCDDEVCICE